MWQIVLTLVFIIEHWYYFVAITLIITSLVSFNRIRKKKRLKIHRRYRETGVLDTKANQGEKH